MKTIKRISAILLAVVLLFSGIPMAELGISDIFTAKAAYEITDKDLVYNDFLYRVFRCAPEGTAIPCIWITKYLGADEHITVPSEIEGLPVMIIDEYAFSPSTLSETETPDCINIKSITIPDTVIQINGYAFYDCANLEQISLPDTIEYIGEYAFGYCTSLKNIKLPYSLQRISKDLFKNSSSLVDVNFGDEMHSLKSIESDAFSGTAIKSLTIPKNAQIGYFNFNKDALNGSPVENLTVETDWTCVYDYSLDNDWLKEVVFEGSVISFDRYAFGTGTIDTNPDRIVFKTDFNEDVCSQLSSQGYLYHREWRDTDWTVFIKPDEENQMLIDGNYGYYINTNDEAVIIAHAWENENGETITVPNTLGGKLVTEIAANVFSGYRMVTVNLPDSLKYIGSNLFQECKNLTTVNFGENVISMGYRVFDGCTSLQNIVLPEGVNKISEQMFYNCTALESVTANGAVTICKEAFAGCTALNSVKFSENMTTIEDKAFYGCTVLKTISLTNSLTSVGEQAFQGCVHLESIGISGESITSLGKSAFSGTALNTFTFSSELKKIPYRVFSNAKIIEVIISKGVEEIGSSAFANCVSLENADLPESIEKIGEEAFYRCENLTGTLTIEENIKIIDLNAFEGTGYYELYFNAGANSSDYDLDSAFSGMNNVKKIVVGSRTTKIGFRWFHDLINVTEVVVSDGVKEIGQYAFLNCSSLKDISLPDTVTKIDEYAFEGCTGIEEFTVPKGVKGLHRTAIPSAAKTVYFNAENCNFIGLENWHSPFFDTDVENVIIGNTVKRIPSYFMAYFENVDKVVLPDSVTDIGNNAFYLSFITNIVFSPNLESIEDEAFYGTYVTIDDNTFPDTLRMIGNSAFGSCGYLEELYIPDSVVYIGSNAFDYCDSLKKVRMSPNVEYILPSTFSNCTALNIFEWDSELKLIGQYAFADCIALADFDFKGVEKLYENSFKGSGVTLVSLGEKHNEEAAKLETIEKQSFKNCADLETISIGGNVATIKSEAFADCSNLEVAVISNSVINIASDAFDGCNSLTIYCMENSYAHDYAVQNNIPVSTFVIAPIPNQTYTGNRIEPELDVSVSNKQLTENTDFTVKYAENINVGTAKVTVSGKGIYKVLTSIANFTIITKNIAPVTIAPVADQNYTGEAVTPSLTVTDGSNILREGTDYTVTYKNNVNTGTATATIKGIGNYSGTASVNFTILEQSFFERLISAISTFFTTIITWLQALFGFKIK